MTLLYFHWHRFPRSECCFHRREPISLTLMSLESPPLLWECLKQTSMPCIYPWLPTHPSFLQWEADGIKICFSFSFSPLGWPNGFVHSSEIARPCGNCRAASGPLEAGQAPGAIGAVEELAAVNRRSLVWTPPAPLERAWVIARGLSLKRRNNVKYAHTFLLYNFAH